MPNLIPTSLAALVLLILVHVATPSLKVLESTPRTVWLSVAGGVSVAYLFVDFLPELAASQEAFAAAAGELTGGLALGWRHVFPIALAGLLTVYGLADGPRSPAPGSRVRRSPAAAPRRTGYRHPRVRGCSGSTWRRLRPTA